MQDAAPIPAKGRAGGRLLRAVEIAGRLVVVILLTYVGLLAVTFFIGRVVPIDPVLAIVGDRAPEHVIARVREELGLNKPLWEQFYIYCSKAVRGDFGRSVLTETVFAWPGLGLYITNSLQNADMNAVLGGTIVVGSIFIGLNLLSDLLYRMLDPRTRRQ